MRNCFRPIYRAGIPAGSPLSAGIKKIFSFSKILFDNGVFYDMIEAEHGRGARRKRNRNQLTTEGHTMDFEAIKKAAQGYEADMTKFLRDLIAIPSESCEEEGVIKRTILEMERLGFDRAEIDPEGNALGWMGDGEKIIAFDGHIDTVGIGNIDNWEQDPYKGYETEDVIYGRGGSDQEGGVVSAVYGAKIMKDLGLIPEGYKILVTATVQEEDCDGLCWQYIHNEDGITPEFVVSTEPTDGGIYRGHRGRMEIRVDVKGVSCHGSAPERGDNAIYKMADIVQEIRALNENDDAETTEIKGLVKMLNPQFNPEHYEDARFLGRGTCTVSQIFYTSPSRCAVADSCAVSIDRRMTAGETWDSCLDEIRALPSVQKYGQDVKVSMYKTEVRDRVLLPHLDQQGERPPRPGPGGGPQGPLRGEARRPPRRHGPAGPAPHRQVDLLHQRRVHPGPLRHPLRGLRPRRGEPGPRPQRDYLEAGSGNLRRRVRRLRGALQGEGRRGCVRLPGR